MTDDHDFESDFSEEIAPHENDDLIDEPAIIGDDDVWEDEETAQESDRPVEATATDAKKKSSVKLIGGIVAAIIIVLLGLHLMSRPAPAPHAAPPPATAAVVAPAAPVASASAPAITGGLMNNPSAIGSVEEMQRTHAADASAAETGSEAAPMPAFAAASSGATSTPATSTTTVTTTAAPASSVANADMAAAPTAPTAATVQPLTPLPSTVSAPAPVASVPVAPVVTTAAPAPRAPDMSATLAPIIMRLDAMDAEIKALKNSTADQASIDAVKSQVTALQAQIDKLPAHASAAETVPASAPSMPATTTPSSPEPTPAAEHKALPHHWSLRSAQPGEALLADKGGKMITVHPGDMVPDLGHIISITEHDGSWIVRGSVGHVSE